MKLSCVVFPFGLDDKGTIGVILNTNGNLFLRCTMQIGPRVHTASYTVNTDSIALQLQ